MNEKTMWVAARPGERCPRIEPGLPKITEEPVEVPDSRFYRRLLSDGSLVSANAPARKHETKPKSGAEK